MKESLQIQHQELLNEIDNYDRRNCESCDSIFYAIQSYEKNCPICFKLEKKYNILKSDKQLLCLQDELSDCYEEINKLEERLRLNEREIKRLKRKTKKQTSSKSDSNDMSLDMSTLKKMIRLCHPDHQPEAKKKIAQEITAILLSEKAKLK